LDQNILRALDTMLRTHNPFPKTFQFAHEVLQTARVESVPFQVFMKIVTEEGTDQRLYNHPTVNEIAALLSDDNATPATRDVIVRLRPTAPMHAVYSAFRLRVRSIIFCIMCFFSPVENAVGSMECDPLNQGLQQSVVV
jgi:hypothetical protein